MIVTLDIFYIVIKSRILSEILKNAAALKYRQAKWNEWNEMKWNEYNDNEVKWIKW